MNKKILAIVAAVILVVLSVVLITARTDDAEPDRLAATTETIKTDATQSGTNDVTSTEPGMTEAVPEETKPSNVQTNVQPESGETLPPKVNVSLGVVEGEETGNIDEFDAPSATKPTEPAEKPVVPTVPTVNPTEPAEKPVNPTEKPETPTEKPTEPVEEPTAPPAMDDEIDVTELTYEMYMAMSGEDQKKVIDQFSTTNDFLKWFKALEAQYKAEHPDVEIGENGMINGGNLGN